MSKNESGTSFTWKIENFSMLPHQFNEALLSPKFVVDAWERVEFYLELWPRGMDEYEGHIGLYLRRDPVDLEIELNFTLTIESTEPSERVIRVLGNEIFPCGICAMGFSNFKSLNYIHNRNKHYLPQDVLTIRCEISPAEETTTELNVNQDSIFNSMMLPKQIVSLTSIHVQRKHIMWTVENVEERMQQSQNVSFLLTNVLKNSPSLKLTLEFNEFDKVDYIPISIVQTCLLSLVERLFVKCKITVTSTSGEYQVSKTSSHLFKLRTSDVWIFPPFLTTNMLEDKNCLNGDDTFRLLCEFSFSYKNGVYHTENDCAPRTFGGTIRQKKKDSELSTCFEQLYVSGRFCEVELKAGDNTFPYYKAVLCARSPVFSAMFENDTKERASGVVEIEDVHPDTLQRMLTYMLSDVLPEDLSSEDVCNLYLVADKYDLASLKSQCSAVLGVTVSVRNVCDLLVFADLHADNSLKSSVSDFVGCHSTEVFRSARWKGFMEDYPKLSCNVMHRMWIGVYDTSDSKVGD